ncbi:unnamed protein product [Moneuplotes crassus]|uniref:Uncharacterized protein n=1 Tax=Euplotes crassus TaxID=5936 RepID=A0AAD1XRU3_EUPCR|nr:unnamed protein product [Moneuplotes crassus]
MEKSPKAPTRIPQNTFSKSTYETSLLNLETTNSESILSTLHHGRMVKLNFPKPKKTLYLHSRSIKGKPQAKYYIEKKYVIEDVRSRRDWYIPSDYEFYKSSGGMLRDLFCSNNEFMQSCGTPKKIIIGNQLNGSFSLHERFWRRVVYKNIGVCIGSVMLDNFTLTKNDVCRILLCGRHLSSISLVYCVIPDQKFSESFFDYYQHASKMKHKIVNFDYCSRGSKSSSANEKAMICNLMGPILKSEISQKMKKISFGGACLKNKTKTLMEILDYKRIRSCFKSEVRFIQFELVPE